MSARYIVVKHHLTDDKPHYIVVDVVARCVMDWSYSEDTALRAARDLTKDPSLAAVIRGEYEG